MNNDFVVFAKALSDNTRAEIVTCLCCVWLNVGEIGEKLGGNFAQSTVSQHLKVLEEAGLVLVRQEGRHRYYTLNRSLAYRWWQILGEALQLNEQTATIPISQIPTLK
jgi:DNA-binding transcriptional ArsR family regulator